MLFNFDNSFLKNKMLMFVESTIKGIYSNSVDLYKIQNLTNSIISEDADLLLVYMAIQIASHKICSVEYYLTVDGAVDELLENQKYMANKEWCEANLKVHKSQAEIGLILVEAYFFKWKKA